ncbi:hypothetical protein ZIOFF_049344 [Zingiber officinale]|uniref:Retrovirus-related Pol polyprotein from transposon TNT 1-94-like beta-barrel domain-containing protein n=1 Tax=Zingiber officinale TaxID=94328 RepID=A0A8J5G925_ZINOF|nr:hypothetical protein ZIOFF_049344 [Zingiber officinale]
MEIIFLSQDLWDMIEEGYMERQDQQGSSSQAGEKEKEYKENVEEEEEEIPQVEEILHGSKKLVTLVLHVSLDCWYKEKGENQKEKKVVNFLAEDDNNKLFFSTMDDEKSGEIWYLDSGCNNHLTGNLSAFEELVKNYSSHVELGDGKQVKIEGKGVIAVHTSGEIKQQHEACEGCIYGKMHRFPFPTTAWRAHFPLELVHADIYGPTRTPLGNKRDVIFDETTTWKWEAEEVTEVPMEGLFLEPKELVKEIVGSLRSNYEDDSDSGSPPRSIVP